MRRLFRKPWIYFVSFVGGILVLAATAYGLFTFAELTGFIHVLRGYDIEVENKLDKPVTISVTGFNNGQWDAAADTFGPVEPGERRSLFAVIPDIQTEDGRYLIEAKDLAGTTIRTWEYPWREMIQTQPFILILEPPS